jgi:hypothetical protein
MVTVAAIVFMVLAATRHPLTGGRGGAPQAEEKIFDAVNNAVVI